MTTPTHASRLFEEIQSYCADISREPVPKTYIDHQVNLVLNYMKNLTNHGEMIDVNPADAEGDFYREMISEGGTVYDDYEEVAEEEEDDA
jgi:hypothetical protein